MDKPPPLVRPFLFWIGPAFCAFAMMLASQIGVFNQTPKWTIGLVFSLGMLITIIAVYDHSLIRKHHGLIHKYKIMSFILCIIFGAAYGAIVWLILYKHPAGQKPPQIDFAMTAMTRNGAALPLDGVIGGIKWEKNYVGLTMDITCKDAPIKILDFELILDYKISNFSIVGIGKISGFGDVTAFPAIKRPAIIVKGYDDKGNPVEIHSDLSGTPIDPHWRVHCENILQGATLRLVIAGIRLSFDSNTNNMEPVRRIQIKGNCEAVLENGGVTNLPFFINHLDPENEPRAGLKTQNVETGKPAHPPSHSK